MKKRVAYLARRTCGNGSYGSRARASDIERFVLGTDSREGVVVRNLRGRILMVLWGEP